jgi:DNA-binding CsgD family transcriptional regulator
MENQALENIRRRLRAATASGNGTEGTRQLELALGASQLFFVGKFGLFVHHMADKTLSHYSKMAEELLGYSSSEVNLDMLTSRVHPQDHGAFVEREKSMVQFFDSLSPAMQVKFKAGHDFRIQKKDGAYIRVYKQAMTLECEAAGAISKMLVIFTDISHLKKSNLSNLAFTSLNGEQLPASPNNAIKPAERPTFTSREIDVLRLVSLNYNTEKIAEKLVISPHTVKIHRKNLLRKSSTRSSLELVIMAKENSWL